jgi:hypothetical protein
MDFVTYFVWYIYDSFEPQRSAAYKKGAGSTYGELAPE